ncbi:hypothetical protein NMB32_17285 [Stenotrophomonas sp. CD2]|nr:hypothetical protein NMB32_17285 [Stenotrophomonas sp. CD2]
MSEEAFHTDPANGWGVFTASSGRLALEWWQWPWLQPAARTSWPNFPSRSSGTS